jgi:ribose 5-phosphate isomerase
METLSSIARRRSRSPTRAGAGLDREMRMIPGVVDTGLFLGTAERVLIGHADGRVETRLRSSLVDG